MSCALVSWVGSTAEHLGAAMVGVRFAPVSRPKAGVGSPLRARIRVSRYRGEAFELQAGVTSHRFDPEHLTRVVGQHSARLSWRRRTHVAPASGASDVADVLDQVMIDWRFFSGATR